jgi:hypothetical protein
MPTREERNHEEASLEQIAKVRELLEASAPRGLMIDGIIEKTGYANYIIHSAIRTLKKQGVNVVGLDPFRYDSDSV